MVSASPYRSSVMAGLIVGILRGGHDDALALSSSRYMSSPSVSEIEWLILLGYDGLGPIRQKKARL